MFLAANRHIQFDGGFTRQDFRTATQPARQAAAYTINKSGQNQHNAFAAVVVGGYRQAVPLIGTMNRQ